MERIILFDGVCNLCNGFVQFIIKRDPKAKFRFGSLQWQTSKSRLSARMLDGKGLDSVVYLRGEKVFVKSAAALEILKDMGGIWQLAYVFMAVPPLIRDKVYDWIASHRYHWFGQRDKCMVPDPELLDRFLEESATNTGN